MNPDLVLLCLSLFTWGIGEGMFLYFQPIYLQQLGADTMTIAGIFSAFGVMMMAAHIPAGYLADRLGRKPLLLAAWGAGLLAAWVMTLARSLPVFTAGMLLYGLTAFVSSPLNSYVTAAAGKMTPVRAMTLASAAFSLGAVLGPLAGGWLGDRFGLQTVYLAASCLFVPSTVMVFFLRSQPREAHSMQSPPAKLAANGRFLGFLGIAFLIMLVTYLPQPLTPKFLENERGLSLSAIGLLGSANGLGNALFNLLLGQFSTRLGLLLVQVCVMGFGLLIWRGAGLGWYALGYFLLGGYRTARSFIFAQVRLLVHPSQMGLAYGVSETVNSLTLVLAPLLAGVLYTRQPAVVYPVAVGLILLTLLVSAASIPRRQIAAQPAAAGLPPDVPFPE